MRITFKKLIGALALFILYSVALFSLFDAFEVFFKIENEVPKEFWFYCVLNIGSLTAFALIYKNIFINNSTTESAL